MEICSSRRQSVYTHSDPTRFIPRLPASAQPLQVAVCNRQTDTKKQSNGLTMDPGGRARSLVSARDSTRPAGSGLSSRGDEGAGQSDLIRFQSAALDRSAPRGIGSKGCTSPEVVSSQRIELSAYPREIEICILPGNRRPRRMQPAYRAAGTRSPEREEPGFTKESRAGNQVFPWA